MLRFPSLAARCARWFGRSKAIQFTRRLFPVVLVASLAGVAIWGLQQPHVGGSDPGLRRKPVVSSEVRRTIVLPPVIYAPDDHTPVQFTVPVVNSLPQAVRFSSVTTSCGCTEAKLDRMELESGAKTTLHVSVAVQGISGVRTVAVHWSQRMGLNGNTP